MTVLRVAFLLAFLSNRCFSASVPQFSYQLARSEPDPLSVKASFPKSFDDVVSGPKSPPGLLGPHCTVKSKGSPHSDVAQLLDAFSKCGKTGGTIVLPDKSYNISEPMTATLENAKWEIHGTLQYTGEIDFWVENSYRFPFQNQSLGMLVVGKDYLIDGMGWRKGGIDGDGQKWYTWNNGESNRFGRPMSIAIVNSTRAIIQNFQFTQPQFWASLVWGSEDITMKGIYVNVTNYDSNTGGRNFVINTDGSDTYQSSRVLWKDWIYQGGDDCISLKGNSTYIYANNITCIGGPGIAFGSVGQYPGVPDIMENVWMQDIKLMPSSQTTLFNGIYGKAWIGVQLGDPPNGGGGGGGYCRNVFIKDVQMQNAERPLYLNTDTYFAPTNQSYANTSTYEWNDIYFENISGTASTDTLVDLECSAKAPCKNWVFKNIDLKPVDDSNPSTNYICHNMVDRQGLDQCHG